MGSCQKFKKKQLENSSQILLASRPPSFLKKGPTLTKLDIEPIQPQPQQLSQETTLENANKNTCNENQQGCKIQRGKLIFQGPNGNVYQCLSEVGKPLIVKTIFDNWEIISPEILESFCRSILPLQNDNLVQLHACRFSQDMPYAVDLIQEYVCGGAIRAWLSIFGQFEEKLIQSFVRQILEGLNYLHENGIVHQNLKSQNVLLDQNGTIKLTDFSLLQLKKYTPQPENEVFQVEIDDEEGSRKFKQQYLLNYRWNFDYFVIAPEVFDEPANSVQNIHSANDIWSLGCIIIEMFICQPFFYSEVLNQEEMCNNIRNQRIPELPKNISMDARDFLDQIFKSKDYLTRPTASELLQHRWLSHQQRANSEAAISKFFQNPRRIPQKIQQRIQEGLVTQNSFFQVTGDLQNQNTAPQRYQSMISGIGRQNVNNNNNNSNSNIKVGSDNDISQNTNYSQFFVNLWDQMNKEKEKDYFLPFNLNTCIGQPLEFLIPGITKEYVTILVKQQTKNEGDFIKKKTQTNINIRNNGLTNSQFIRQQLEKDMMESIEDEEEAENSIKSIEQSQMSNSQKRKKIEEEMLLDLERSYLQKSQFSIKQMKIDELDELKISCQTDQSIEYNANEIGDLTFNNKKQILNFDKQQQYLDTANFGQVFLNQEQINQTAKFQQYINEQENYTNDMEELVKSIQIYNISYPSRDQIISLNKQ